MTALLTKSMAALAGRPFFAALQRALALALPLVMVGVLFTLPVNLPLPAFHGFLDRAFGPGWRAFSENMIQGSFGVASLAVLCSFGSCLAGLHNQRRREHHVSGTMTAVVVLSCFFVIARPGEASTLRDLIPLDRGLLVALCVAMAGSQLFLALARVESLRLPMSAVGQDPVVNDVLTLLPAGMATILAFGLARSALDGLGVANLYQGIQELFREILGDHQDSLALGLAYSGLSQLLWLFGAHGPNLLYPVEAGVLGPAALSNASAVLLGQPAPCIVTKPFLDAFTLMGGSGSTLCLILAILARGREPSSRKLCLFALVPALCNVNEPLLFGIPLVFNPVFALPFLSVPIVQAVVAYAATVAGLVPATITTMSWTTPVLLSGYVATGSSAGTVLQLVNLGLGCLVYLPFVALANRVHERTFRQTLDRLLATALDGSADRRGIRCLDRPGAEGRLARALSMDLRQAMDRAGQLHLEYQPQCDSWTRTVVGMEALLRWKHPAFGFIPPPVTVALAEDTGLIGRLGLWVLKEACATRAAWNVFLAKAELTVSVNLSPRQFRDPGLFDRITRILAETGISPGTLVIEITESVALLPDSLTLDTLNRLRQAGVRLAIDDFGMGYASLRYLREFPVDVIKIDRSLTQESKGEASDHIVRSLAELGQSLGCRIVVEGLETREQYLRFRALGCAVFQGFLFSRPLSGEACLDFALNRIKNHPVYVKFSGDAFMARPLRHSPAGSLPD